MNYLILGGYGNIGRVIAEDLFAYAPESKIIIAGHNERKAQAFAATFKSKRVQGVKAEAAGKEIVSLLKKCGVCINATQYYHNLEVMKACLKAKTNYIDLGGLYHMTKKQLKLNKAFQKIKKTALLGCGSTPGITNIMAAFGSTLFDTLKSIEISFADAEFTPYRQKFVLPYSFHTLIDEFTLNPIILAHGKMKETLPLAGEKVMHYDMLPKEFQDQKGSYTLHSELATFPSSFREKKLKECYFRVTFPEEFIKKIRTLIELGLTSQETVFIKYDRINIRDAAAKIMEQWLPQNIIKDEEVLRIEIEGKKKGKAKKVILDAVAKSKGKFPAGTYNTGVPASIIALMIGQEIVTRKGVFPPEQGISTALFFQELKKREIAIFLNNNPLEI